MGAPLGWAATFTAVVAGGLAITGAGRVTAAAAGGTIKGHVHLQAKPRANPLIRMGMDPKCADLNRGRRRIQELVVVGAEGGLANAFVKLQGPIGGAAAPVPTAPVVLDQVGCLYTPRVLGARVGQTLVIRNSDDVLHNLHSLSPKANSFNVSQPKAGMSYEVKLKDEDAMLRLKCDIHSWMVAFVGIAAHPYFAVSGADGSFEIRDVPPGAHTVRVWHEQFGELTAPARVAAGATVTVDLSYSGAEKPVARLEDRIFQ